MRTSKMKVLFAAVLGSLLTGACGMSGRAETLVKDTETPEKAAQCAMESLGELDLETFNACTDNYVETYYNWLGIPVEAQYRIFNELLQPGRKTGKRYRFNLRMAEKIVEIFADGERLEAFHRASYEIARDFSNEIIAEKWRRLLT